MNIQLKHWEQDMDLRKLSRGKLFWWAAKRKLKSGEAVLFTNSRLNRCRIIVVFDGLPWMLSPPVYDKQHTLGFIFDAAMEWAASLRGASKHALAV